MKFTYLTLFPELIEAYFQNSIMKRAVEKNLIEYKVLQLRDFANDSPYHACDDAPYGGGAGMLLKSAPVALALESISAREKLCIYPSPSGYPFQQKIARALSCLEFLSPQKEFEQLKNSDFLANLKNSIQNMHEFHLRKTIEKFNDNNQISREIVFICGRYEGIDQRIIDDYVDLELSTGDYVLSSGELGSLCLTDAIYRLCDGVISKESLASESFSKNLLEYPQYTRPEYFCGQCVPEVLLSGHHEKIRLWQLEQSVRITFSRRPELLQQAQDNNQLSSEVLAILQKLQNNDAMEITQ